MFRHRTSRPAAAGLSPPPLRGGGHTCCGSRGGMASWHACAPREGPVLVGARPSPFALPRVPLNLAPALKPCLCPCPFPCLSFPHSRAVLLQWSLCSPRPTCWWPCTASWTLRYQLLVGGGVCCIMGGEHCTQSRVQDEREGCLAEHTCCYRKSCANLAAVHSAYIQRPRRGADMTHCTALPRPVPPCTAARRGAPQGAHGGRRHGPAPAGRLPAARHAGGHTGDGGNGAPAAHVHAHRHPGGLRPGVAFIARRPPRPCVCVQRAGLGRVSGQGSLAWLGLLGARRS